MKVFLNGNLICIETNAPFALKYWTARKAIRPGITWEILGAKHV